MSTQRQRKTKGRRDRRRVRFTMQPKKKIACSKCGKMILAHQVCPSCGHYKGKEVVRKVVKAKRKK